MKKLKLAYSTCPNDTFMFYGIAAGIFSPSFQFDTVLKDIEELNKMAFKGETDITKLSFFAYFKIADKFKILNSGSALGRGCGPLLIAKEEFDLSDLKNKRIAIPGKNTTANLLFSIFCPECKNKKEVLFSEIENEILKGEVDAGVIIHETRFTYKIRGLKKLVDLGEFWERETGNPIPLGLIAVKRDYEKEGKELDNLLRKSIEYAFENPSNTLPYIKKYAQELDESVINSHINLYVNKFSINLGEEGKKAITDLYQKAYEIGLVQNFRKDIFL
ncbi:1,4-dihydroxy-6-naphthoate synthase [Thermotomaculum hydrothermale]|uniref:1,4-dihydroxy-6-naphtoate synthase n=1 Tax=Thermotomaculum hydrothermale TaxID=981385 RepID=A0A7R6T0B9_9BACT|nr:1,4-dihydroxy-6-naphthoate synthase [Thermotomaculum hydrothermale]BBB33585.1 1,4-dihydroxy-6-naphthoate synthase [Thermotomaculum hydrothermale]